MKAKLLLVFAAVILLCGLTSVQAQTPAPKLTVSPSTIDFGDHDIGTATSTVATNTVTVSNGHNAAVSLSLTSSGPNTDDFKTTSNCGSTVPAKGHCQISVAFNPGMIKNGAGIITGTGPIDRSATLEFKTDTDTDIVTVKLTGRAFQNLGAAPSVVDLPIQRWVLADAPRPIVLTNYTDALLESVSVSVDGNFTEDHAGCVKIDPGKKCTIFVAYPPKESGDANGALAFTGTIAPAAAKTKNSGKIKTASATPPFRRLTRGVVLNGTSYSGWRRWQLDVHSWFLLGISAAYFLTLVS